MKKRMLGVVGCFLVAQIQAATLYVDISSTGAVPPYNSWATAATNIQDAVDAASANDSVWVTNGVYNTGSRVVYGSMMNRVVIDKAITVQSVNGPDDTLIEGQGPNGDNAVRCVYLAADAFLSGFTLTNGHTRLSTDLWKEESGGGVWCEASATVSNCLITGNAATSYGAGALYGTLNDCTLSNNSGNRGSGATLATLNGCILKNNHATGWGGATYRGTLNRCVLQDNSADDDAGGAYDGTLYNCVLSGNSAVNTGGGAGRSTLINCTVTGNTAGYGGGIYDSIATNSVIWGNTASTLGNNWYEYYNVGELGYCCTIPLPQGPGNIDSNPLLATASHLSLDSACIGAGSSAWTTGTDIDGEAWLNPPSIGCDEVYTGNITGPLSVEVSSEVTTVAVGFEVDFSGSVMGHANANEWDFDDGTITSNQLTISHSWVVAGTYDLTFTAFNEDYPAGISTTRSITVQAQPTHYVDLNSTTSVAPYNSWATASTNIQDAIDSTTLAGALVLVSNGVYNTGSLIIADGLRNRVAINKPITVKSLNGYAETTIQGLGPHGDNAVRCVYLGTGATLSGFTLTGGHTRTLGDWDVGRSAGAIWSEHSGMVTNCLITGNSARGYGGAVFNGTLSNCTLTNNTAEASGGGGAIYSTLDNCTLANNSAYRNGGGASQSTLRDCIISGNTADYGGGVDVCTVKNSDFTNNTANDDGGGSYDSVLTDCDFSRNSAEYGGGGSGGVLNSGSLSSNEATDGGGGWYSGVVSNCRVENNTAESGGGTYYCTVNNSTLIGNSSTYSGGGAENGELNNCIITGNSTVYDGGGAAYANLNNCSITDNTSDEWGGGIEGCIMTNCTVTGNSSGIAGGGTAWADLFNCIVWDNSAPSYPNNYDINSLEYSCTTPLAIFGTGNTDQNPQLADYTHLSADSPCIGAGNAPTTGTDIDGDPWLTPPSMGCDEYSAGLATGALSVAISANYSDVTVGFPINFIGDIEGFASSNHWDFGSSTLENQLRPIYSWATPGTYTVTVTVYNETNPSGVSDSLIVNVYAQPIHYVDASSVAPASPYSSWGTASTTIQAAIDSVTLPGALVLVTNGLYNSGGKIIDGSMMNRVAVDKVITVQSVNGPSETIIEGAGPNGDTAVRCVYLMEDATLSGFTLTNGHTRVSGDYYTERSGGGIWGKLSSVVSNCLIVNNSSDGYGGGSYSCTLNSCTLLGNTANNSGGGAYESTLDSCILRGNSALDAHGGGAYDSTLKNCALIGNSSSHNGGGAVLGTLINCTVTENRATLRGGGVDSSDIFNSIIWNNEAPDSPNWYDYSGFPSYSCTTPLPTGGIGNIDDNPQLASRSHLSTNSPCIGAGSSSYSGGTDIDGETWDTSPAMGCDELVLGSATSPLTVKAHANQTDVTPSYEVKFSTEISGQTTASKWRWKDGSSDTHNNPFASHVFISSGIYDVELIVYNDSYPAGVTGTVAIVVGDPVKHYVNVANTGALAPYTSWATAATNIQDAIDATTQYGAHVVVTNGTYDVGSSLTIGLTPNRVSVKDGLTVTSVNGPTVTSITGVGPNGASAIRCVYLGNETFFTGFTLSDGATQTIGDYNESQAGGGIWSEKSAIISNCLFTANSSGRYGGAAYQGTLLDCNMSNNSSVFGAGTAYSTVKETTFSGNTASSRGGATYYGDMLNCIMTNNSATGGGASSYGILENCILANNTVTGDGGASYISTLKNCTITGNAAGDDGGGCYSGTLVNSIIYGNTGPDGINYKYSTMSYSCSTPLPSGTGNISSDPLFVNAASGDYHLQASSPAIDRGNNADMVVAYDLDGTARPIDGNNSGTAIVDMGCYEFFGASDPDSDGDGIPDWWELLYFGGITNCVSTDHSDSDVYDNGQEYISGTDPTNETSFIGITNGVSMASGYVIQWGPSVSNREYAISWTNDLSGTFTSLVNGIEFPQNSYTDTLHGAEGAGFYKVEVQLK